MNFLSIIPYYLSWHYSQGILGYFNLWKNFLWFLWNFFSIKILLRTFFQPFKRLKEKYHGGLDVENFLSTLIITTIMRLVGMVLRAVIIVIGIVVVVIFIVGGLLGFLAWLVLPFLTLWFLIISIIALTK